MKLAVVLATALGLAASDELARVGSTPITRGAFELRASAFRAERRLVTPELVVDSLVDEVVLADEARRNDRGSAPAVRARLATERRRVLANAVAARSASAEPSADELRASYHATNDFVRMQLLAYASAADASAARERLAKGAALAEEAARARRAQVAAPDASAPYLMRAQLDAALARAAFAVRAGDLVGPVEAGGEWLVARVLQVIIGDDAGFEASRPALAARARERSGEALRSHLISKLQASTPVTIDEPFLAKANAAQATPAELDQVVARVGDDSIVFAEVAVVVRSIAARSSAAHAGDPHALRKVLDGLVGDALLAREARARRIDTDPDVRANLVLVERGVLASTEFEAVAASVASESPEQQGELIRARVKRLRDGVNVRIDRAAVAQAGSLLR